MTHAKPPMGALPIFTDEELRRLDMPVLLLMGDRDPLRDPVKIAARLEALVPRLTSITVKDGGHALPDAQADVLALLQLAGSP